MKISEIGPADLNAIHYYQSWFNAYLKKSDYIIFGSILLLCAVFRTWFWYTTDLTLEDALITFRYAENIAAGNGFVYNSGDRILGSTTPLWTLLLAGAKFAGTNLFIATKIIGILLDVTTCFLIILILRGFSLRLTAISALLFATSPAIVPISISGMETSLLLLAMTILLYGYSRKNFWFGTGLALTILTRFDGALFALIFFASAFLDDKKWAFRQLIIAFLCCMPWYLFSFFYFGNVLPQSYLAKRAIYNLSISISASPFIGSFTPFLETQPLKALIKSVIFVLLITGIIISFKKKSIFLPGSIFYLIYCAIFMTSGIIMFNWYLVPPIFISFLIMTVAIDWYIDISRKIIQKSLLKYIFLPILLFAIFLSNISILEVRTERYRQLQQFENDLRKPIGLWLRDNASPNSTVFLEPLGYIGYFAGQQLTLWDEIGLVNRKVVEYRQKSHRWYTETLMDLKPDYIVQYAEALDLNKSEGAQTPLFIDETERTWFFNHYESVFIKDVTDNYPFIDKKEKKFVILKKSNPDL